jgi:ABC-2 type transport system permease protein
MSHIEEDIAYLDIKEGQLSKYLIKPFSYYWIKFYEEIPYRLLQGIFAIVAFSFFYIFFNTYFRIHLSMTQALLSICIMLAAYFLSFTFKMVIGMIAFWITDIGGVFEILEIILIIFTGNLMPLFLLPQPLSSITLLLPFASMIYYPVMAIEGNLDILHMGMALGQQLIWLGFFLVLYMFMWNKGVKKFSGVGQ